MSEGQNSNQPQVEPKVRPVGGTEYSWCRAVPGGTGITVLGLLLSKAPDLSLLQNALQKLQIVHPILNSKLHHVSTTNTFSIITTPTPHIQIQPFDLSSTSDILRGLKGPGDSSVSEFHLILEHELNKNDWCKINKSETASNDPTDMFFASVYTLGNEKWVVALRLHTAACDRSSAVGLLRELLVVMGERVGEGERTDMEFGEKFGVGLAIEDCIPKGKVKKPFWARGVDMLGYSLNAFRLANLEFKDTKSPRSTNVVRLQIDPEDTNRIPSGCKSRGIKLCGALAAAGLIAARSSKCLPDDQREKYAVVTITDCRSILDPVLSSHHFGFYHSAILNTHNIKGGEKLWELAKRTYTSFVNAKNKNKHFSDMADLNFLMSKAIENPGLTPSSSLRTAIISVFEDSVIDHSNEVQQQELGVEDYIECGSVHGVGPSISVFDTIRDGALDCSCAYPSPLHSRKQMLDLVNDMKKILVDAGNFLED